VRISRSTGARRHRPVGLDIGTGVLAWYRVSRSTGARRRRPVGLGSRRCRLLLLRHVGGRELLLRRVRLVHRRCRFFLRVLLHRRLMHGRRWRLINRSGCGLVHRRWCLFRWRGLYRRLNGLLLPRGQTAAERPTAAAERATAKSAAARSVAGLRGSRGLRVG
jgi:hypothetical protein